MGKTYNKLTYKNKCMNIVGVEIDIVVTDSLKALALYENIFEIEPVEVTNFPKGEVNNGL